MKTTNRNYQENLFNTGFEKQQKISNSSQSQKIYQSNINNGNNISFLNDQNQKPYQNNTKAQSHFKQTVYSNCQGQKKPAMNIQQKWTNNNIDKYIEDPYCIQDNRDSYSSIKRINGMKVKFRQRQSSAENSNQRNTLSKSHNLNFMNFDQRKPIEKTHIKNMSHNQSLQPLNCDQISKKDQGDKGQVTINLDQGLFKGQVFDGQMNGQGEIKDLQGNLLYQGGFKESEFDGYGILYNENLDSVFMSQYDSTDFNLNTVNWTKYQGLFKKSNKHGIGYLYLQNGDVFLGEFSNDKANGLGIYKTRSQKIIGVWKSNILYKKL